MKDCRLVLIAASILGCVSCAPKASLTGTIEGISKESIAIAHPNSNMNMEFDTVKTGSTGRFKYTRAVEAGQPEIVYVYRNGVKLASAVLEKGSRINVNADTTGNWTVEGSEESAKLQKVEQDYAQFMDQLRNITDKSEFTQIYVKYYRDRVKYIMDNPHSITVVPVLMQKINANSPVFSQKSDALHFRAALDSLKAVFPESGYLKSLEAETVRRENVLVLDAKLREARHLGFPDMEMPDQYGKKQVLSNVKSKVIILHFWDAENAGDKMYNLDTLKPLYEQYKSKGLEIFSVCITADKALWATTIRNQGLDWINVNDGKGSASTKLNLYKISKTPTCFIISDGALVSSIEGGAGLTKEISRILK